MYQERIKVRARNRAQVRLLGMSLKVRLALAKLVRIL
jgi:hypothetical protein